MSNLYNSASNRSRVKGSLILRRMLTNQLSIKDFVAPSPGTQATNIIFPGIPVLRKSLHLYPVSLASDARSWHHVFLGRVLFSFHDGFRVKACHVHAVD